MSLPSTLILVRHTHKAPDFSGSDLDRPLSPTGIEQAKSLGLLLPEIVSPDLVLSSSYRRTRDTGILGLTALGLGATEIIEDPRLGEHDRGNGGGGDYALDMIDREFAGGETVRRAAIRKLTAIADREVPVDGTVLAFGHSGTMVGLRAMALERRIARGDLPFAASDLSWVHYGGADIYQQVPDASGSIPKDHFNQLTIRYVQDWATGAVFDSGPISIHLAV